MDINKTMFPLIESIENVVLSVLLIVFTLFGLRVCKEAGE